MVGLSVVLEGDNNNNNNNNNNSMMKSYSTSSGRSSCTHSCNSCTSPTIVSKSSMIKTCSPTAAATTTSSSSSSSSSPNPFSRRRSLSLPSNRNLQYINGFLDHCFLCRVKLLPGKDIYMYKGDRGFCSEECRCRQIFMDEEEAIKVKTDNCSFSAIKPQNASSSSSTTTRKGPTKRANGFAY